MISLSFHLIPVWILLLPIYLSFVSQVFLNFHFFLLKSVSGPTVHELSYFSCKSHCKKWKNIQTFIQRTFFDPKTNFSSCKLPLYTSVMMLISTNKISCYEKIVVTEWQSYFPKTKIYCCNLDYTPFWKHYTVSLFFLTTIYCIDFTFCH